MDKSDKTNVMRILDGKKVPYIPHFYDPSITTGTEVAAVLGQDADHVFKTLVTTGKTGAHYVFVIPVQQELDLKKAARAAGEKSVEMLKQKDLLPLTGYIHGGCSPIGMKKQFMTTLDESARSMEQICISGGRVGAQVQLDPGDLERFMRISYADLTV